MHRKVLVLLCGGALLSACTSSKPAATEPTLGPATPGAEGTVQSPLPQGAEEVRLDPANFVATIDNPYWPMSPGSRWVYRETAGDGTVLRVEVTVTGETKDIVGIKATVVHDIVTEDGQVVEDTLDWYGQDKVGNLWYLGEDTKEYEKGKLVSTKGSWETGVDGAQAGIILPADPEPGMVYRQEYYEGQAEDGAEILSLNELAQVPFGFFDHVLMTKDYTPLEPRLLEHKFYAEGIGPVMTLTVSGGSDREVLISYKKG